MIKVRLSEISPSGGYSKIVDMPAVPREGEGIALDPGDAAFTVRSVIWVIGDPDFDVEVRFRP